MKEIVSVCQKFAEKHIGSYALEADLNGDLNWLHSVWQKSSEIGIIPLGVPAELGGVGQSDACCALVLDAFAAECAGVASVYLHQYVALKAILAAEDAQRTSLFSTLINDKGKSFPILSVIFPSDMDDRHISIREKEGKVFIQGTSPLTGNAVLSRYIVVFLREERDNDTMTCILIRRESPGIALGDDARLPGLRVNPFAPVIFNDVEITQECIIGKRGEAKALYETSLEVYYGFVAACALGAARRAYSKALKYAQDRYQFGTMIINHQEIQRMLGNMLAKLAVGTSSYITALSGEVEGMFMLPFKGSRFAKVFCTDAALEIAIDAVQVHGGYGYTHDYGVEKIMRDIKVLQLLGESNPVLHIKTIQDIVHATNVK
ncbi:MAG: acyl-CoA dehydrogenase family protein [Desulfomonilia bacterium]